MFFALNLWGYIMFEALKGGCFTLIPFYSIMLIIAAVSALIMLNALMKKDGFSKFVKKRVRNSYLWSAIFATLFSNITNWFFHDELMTYSLYDRLTKGGFSFIAWMLCFIGFSALFLRFYKLDVSKCLDVAIPPLLLGTFFARIGCLFGGCCYGVSFTIANLKLSFPVREIEAIFALILSIILCCKFKGKRLRIYLFAYPLFRFFTEFLRGDDRGAIFGIDILSPTQIISALILIVMIVIVIIKANKKEKNNISIEEITETEDNVTEIKNYVPRAINFDDPTIKTNPLTVILNVILVFSIVTTSIFVYNPLNFKWISNLKYYAQDKLNFLFDEGSSSFEIGNSISTGVIDVNGKAPIYNEEEALALIGSFDEWNNNTYSHYKTSTLSNGNKLYTFIQTIDNVQVFGKASSIVVDKNNKPIFVIKDAANDSFLNVSNNSKTRNIATKNSIDLSEFNIIKEKECLYDNGTELRNAKYIQFKDKIGGVHSAIFDTKKGEIIEFFDSNDELGQDVRAQKIIKASKNIVKYFNENKTGIIKDISKNNVKSLDIKNTEKAVEASICKSYIKSGLESKAFVNALQTTTEIASHVPNLNEQLYCDILSENIKQTALENEIDAKKTEKIYNKVKSSFKSNGIKELEDEKPIHIDVKERKTVLKNTISSANDTDIFELHMEENSIMTLKIDSDIGIDIEVYSKNGKNILTTYTASEYELKLYPEDGTDFIIKIKASNAQKFLWEKSKKYKISVDSVEAKGQIPEFINSTLYQISAAFSSSNVYPFTSLFYGDVAFTGDELIAIAFLPVIDNCSATCSDPYDTDATLLDTGKECIIEKIAILNDGMYGINTSPASVMEISCFRYITTDDGAMVKAKIRVTDSSKVIYEGYSFFKLTLIKEVNTFDFVVELGEALEMDPSTAQKISKTLNTIFSNKYYITELNTEEILSAFGDTFDNISDENGIPSLYDFWENQEDDCLKVFNKQAALEAGHSKERVTEFEKYTIMHNIAYYKKVNEKLLALSYSINLIAEGSQTCFDTYSLVTDLKDDALGTVIDSTDNEVLKSLYSFIDFIIDAVTGDFEGAVENVGDDMKGDFLDSIIQSYIDEFKGFADLINEEVEKINAIINEYNRELKKFKKKYSWEWFF